MKTFVKLIVGIVILSMPSCNSFLEEDPRGQQMRGTFYATDEEALGGLMGLYSKMINSGVGIRSNLLCQNEAMSDLLTYKPVAAIGAVAFPKYMLTAELVGDSWTYMYSALYGINSFIVDLENSTSTKLTQTKKEQYIKEAKFFRALMYYHLVMRWGDVPLYTEPTDVKNPDIARTPAAQVWEQVIRDLTDASTMWDKSQLPDGRVSKGATLLLLAKTHLMTGDYASAGTVLDQITGYSLVSIDEIWSTQHKYNNESIWEINREKGTLPSQENTLLGAYLPLHTDFRGCNSTYPVNDYLLMMAEPESPRTKLYYSRKPSLQELSDSASSGYKGEYTYTNNAGKNVRIVFTNATQPLYANLMKFTNFSATGHQFQLSDSPFNVIVFRYADVLLMKAEVECELNGMTSVALEYLNQIRRRAGETEYTITGEPGKKALITTDELREVIRNERALELAGEGHRFYDLKRWGNKYAMDKLKASRQAQIPGTTFCYKPEDLTNIEEFRLLWPIPEGEMRGNKLMTQNPGY